MYSFPHCFYHPSVIATVHLTRCILSLHYLPGLWRLLIWCWCTGNIVSRVLYKIIIHSISHSFDLFTDNFCCWLFWILISADTCLLFVSPFVSWSALSCAFCSEFPGSGQIHWLIAEVPVCSSSGIYHTYNRECMS